jgi:hypothetical protein
MCASKEQDAPLHQQASAPDGAEEARHGGGSVVCVVPPLRAALTPRRCSPGGKTRGAGAGGWGAEVRADGEPPFAHPAFHLGTFDGPSHLPPPPQCPRCPSPLCAASCICFSLSAVLRCPHSSSRAAPQLPRRRGGPQLAQAGAAPPRTLRATARHAPRQRLAHLTQARRLRGVRCIAHAGHAPVEEGRLTHLKKRGGGGEKEGCVSEESGGGQRKKQRERGEGSRARWQMWA